MERRILHIDMDAFFASVEEREDPSLRGKPLIIGGDWESVRGVVSTASYAARKYGVHSAMPLTQARKLCPNGIFMRGHPELYTEASRQVRAILETVSPLVEMASIDEAYVDVTGSQKLFGGDDAIASYIKTEIRRQTQLPSTLAISPNKLVSKIASDLGKPDGYIRVANGEERAFLAPLPVKKIPGAGPRTCEVLESLGIQTIGQLAEAPQAKLEGVFGHLMAISLQRAARGISDSPVESFSMPKSIGRETTFDQDISDWEQLEKVLSYLTERCTYTLRAQGLETKRVTLKVRYPPFETHTFARTLPEPTCVDADILDVLRELVSKARERRAKVRLIGVTLSALRYNQHQMTLFGGERSAKWEKTMESVDKIRVRHGFSAMRFGKSLGLGQSGTRDLSHDYLEEEWE